MDNEQKNFEEAMQHSLAAARPRRPRHPSDGDDSDPPRPPPLDEGPPNVARGLAPSSYQPAARQVVIADALPHPVAFKLAFLGTGQGGSRMADAFWRIGYRRVAVLNTTDMDFKGISDEVARLNLAIGGAAKDPQFAANSLKGREEEVRDLLTQAFGNDPDYILLCVGLGGGTGSGTAPRLVELARQYLADKRWGEPKVGAVVSLPPVGEGQAVARNAVNGFKALLDLKVSPLVIIDNARIHALYDPPLAELHPRANLTVSQLFHLFNRLAAVHSDYVTFDQSELAQLLDGGIVVMGAADIAVADIRSPADISRRIREELTNNVLATVDLHRGRKAACLFVGSADVLGTFSLDYFDAGFTQLDRIVGSARPAEPTVIHRGVYKGKEAGLQCYTMISELDPPMDRLAELAKKGMVGAAANPKSLASFLRVQD